MVTFRTDEEAMRHALRLAERGTGSVEPNPAVGAVVVGPDGELLGEGWHQRYGQAHAEVNALAAAGDRSRGATLYVTLEPCSHVGKTPACAPLVVRSGVRRVVVATGDPAPHVAGRGLAILREAGLDVSVGTCEAEARRLVAPFVTLMTRHRPYVHAKWAMTLDGRIATRTGHSQWISSVASRRLVHEIRGRMDAILVGRGTVLADDPLLTARPTGPRTALRIVLDSTLAIPMDSRLVQTAREIPVLVATTSRAPQERIVALRELGVEVQIYDSGHSPEAPQVDLAALMKELGARQVTNLLVEGGGQTLGTFRDAGLIDELHVFIAPKIVGSEGLSPVGGAGLDRIPEGAEFDTLETRTIDGDIYWRGVRKPPVSTPHGLAAPVPQTQASRGPGSP